MRMLNRFTAAGLVLAAVLLSVAPSFAQGLGGTGAWTYATQDLSFHRTSNSLTGYVGGQGDSKLFNVAGTQVGTARDSTFIVRANTAGQMQFDTLSTISIADLKDWVPVRSNPSTAAVVSQDSLWVFSIEIYPVNDGFTSTLGGGTTGGGATITADSVSYYHEISFDGGQTWSRTRSGNGITSILEVGSSNAFFWAMNSLNGSSEAAVDSPNWFFGGQTISRFILIHDCAGKYGARVVYPRALR